MDLLVRVVGLCWVSSNFQKRGLPHIHLLIIFDDNTQTAMSAADIDRIVCAAELPGSYKTILSYLKLFLQK